MVFENVMDPILRPLLVLPDVVFLMVIAIFFAVITNVAYKFLTNQNLMKDLKAEMKEFQKEIKELKDNPAKAMAVQKKSMATNMKYMQHSMRPMLFTMLPILLIFGWLNAHMAYNPLLPGDDFSIQVEIPTSISGSIGLSTYPSDTISIIGPADKELLGQKYLSWILNPKEEGTYLLEFDINGETVQKEVIISSEKGTFSKVVEVPKSPSVKKIVLSNEKKKITIFNGFRMGWIWIYIILLTVFNMGLKKILKVY